MCPYFNPTECPDEWYGLDCKHQCSGHCRDNNPCNKVTGGHSAHIVALKHILSAGIYRYQRFFPQANGARKYALNFDTSCCRRKNMPSTLKQIVAENFTDFEVK